MEVTRFDADALFAAERPRLYAIAYRMLGNNADAEDVVQDAWLRWRQHAGSPVDNPPAYLTRIITRLSIDALRALKRARGQYAGPWLPSVTVAEQTTVDSPESALALGQTLSVALLLMLETLNPKERATFVLREAFGMSYKEIGECLEAKPKTCRQWAKRAREQLAAVPWREREAQAERELLERFVTAIATGQADSVVKLLDPDVTLLSDGGGKVAAATRPLHGTRQVTRFLLGLAARGGATFTHEVKPLSGGWGLLLSDAGKLDTVVTVAIRDARIGEIYMLRNPDKLRPLVGSCESRRARS